MKIEFDGERALEVFRILERAWKQREGIFKGVVLPQDRWPLPDDPKEKANFLFYAALPMRGGISSDDPFRWMRALWEEDKNLFDPEVVSKWTTAQIIKMFKSITSRILEGREGLTERQAGPLGYKMFEHAENWLRNSTFLKKWWGGDIRNVFWGIAEFEEAFRRIDYRRSKAGFRGMRRKIFSLLVIWLQEKDLIRRFPTPLPVDFHTLRVLWETEIIGLPAKPFMPSKKHPAQLKGKLALHVSENLVDQVAKWSQNFMAEHGFSALDINPAIWVLSRTLCSGYIQNRVVSGRFLESEDLKRNLALWPENYKDPCGRFCPIQNFCKWAIPSSPYYGFGRLLRLGERIPYPFLDLPGIEKGVYKPKK